MYLSKLLPCFRYENNNIIKLDYSNNILSEGLPEVWQYERTLEELNVISTRIKYLPPQLFYCHGLKVLLANNNSLENIPEDVGLLRQLQKLNISRNFITNLPDNIKSCKNLTYLDLSCNALQKLPNAITYLISLQELILNETYLEYLPANFGRLVNLRVVELRSNNLVSLPKSMQRLINLQRLDIGCNEFTEIPEVIGQLKQLREFWFDFNQIQKLPPYIGKLRELVHCEANGNCLTYLPNEICNWLNIEVLSVSTNNLNNLPFSCGMLKSLVVLKCEYNQIVELPESISALENLEELVVSHNKLIRFPSAIGMLRKLRFLFADDNNLQNLPDEICSCSLLSILSVSQNKLSALPETIGRLTYLKVLNIVENNIATLPVTILSLANLKSLWIGTNQSQPLIPLQYADISSKTQLTCFMLPQQKIKKYFCNEGISTDTKRLTGEAAACKISKRRICFSEEATILHRSTEINKLILPTLKSTNLNNEMNDVNNSRSPLSPSIYDCTKTKGDNGNIVYINNSKEYLLRSPTPYPKDLRLVSKYLETSHEKYVNFQKTNKEKIFIKDSYVNLATCLQQPHIDNVKVNENTEIAMNSTINSPNDSLIFDSTLKPPPYHIARCFTKKSVEDLTNYDFARKQIEEKSNIQNKHVCLKRDHSKNFETETCPEEKLNNENILMFNQINVKDERAEIDSEINQTTDFKIIEVDPNVNVKYISKPRTSNISSNKKLYKTKTKWVFGVHKNPRVIQVSINYENGHDFEIDKLPERDGIFVVSTASESYASLLLHPYDKLLEVDGVDFTNINIEEARQIIDNGISPISIMLSRK